MWFTAFAEDGTEPTGPPPFAPPDNEIPVGVPLSVMVARTTNVAFGLVVARVYSNGWELDGLALSRQSSGLDLLPQGHHEVVLHVGVEYADGRRGSTVASFGRPYGEAPSEAVMVQSRGGGGSNHQWSGQWWIHPVPPPGPMLLVFAAPGLGIDETSVTIDATPLAQACERVVELWPWERDTGDVELPPVPEFPAGSWFSSPAD